MCGYTTLWNVNVLNQIENETCVITNFKELTTGNNVFIVSVIIKSTVTSTEFLHHMFNVSALLLNNALLKCFVT